MRCPHCRFDIQASAKFSEECGGRLQSRFEAADTAEVFGNPSRQSFEKIADDEFIEKYADDAVMASLAATSFKREQTEP